MDREFRTPSGSIEGEAAFRRHRPNEGAAESARRVIAALPTGPA
jgi:hypothetical protein